MSGAGQIVRSTPGTETAIFSSCANDAAMITRDTGMIARCRFAAIPVLSLAEEWELPPTQTPAEKAAEANSSGS